METCELVSVRGDVSSVLGVLLRIEAGSTEEWSLSAGSNVSVAFQGDGLGNVTISVQEVRFLDG